MATERREKRLLAQVYGPLSAHVSLENGYLSMNWHSFRTERAARGKPFVVAHRGIPREEPENTLSSFAGALEQGAHALETDLRFTRDGEIVLFHDESVERTTDGEGNVSDLSLAEIKRLRTRYPGADSASGGPVPGLTDLLDLTDGQIPLLLELKDPRFQDLTYAGKLVRILRDYAVLERCAIVSFQLAYVNGVTAVEPEIPSGYITLKNPWPRRRVELLGPAWPLLFLNPFYVRLAHRAGNIVAPLDTEPEKRMGYYLRLGVDAVLADSPRRALEAMEKRP
jgi:glycerophosphoryl diester phosphodiesterase